MSKPTTIIYLSGWDTPIENYMRSHSREYPGMGILLSYFRFQKQGLKNKRLSQILEENNESKTDRAP